MIKKHIIPVLLIIIFLTGCQAPGKAMLATAPTLTTISEEFKTPLLPLRTATPALTRTSTQLPIEPSVPPTQIPISATSTRTINPSPTVWNTPTSSKTPYTGILVTPIPNKVGLIIEENEIVNGSMDADLRHFLPVFGSQEAVLDRHSAGKQAIYQFSQIYDNSLQIMYPINGGSTYRAVETYTTDADGIGHAWVFVEQDGKEIFQAPAGDISPIDALRSFWMDGPHWVLEIAAIKNTFHENEVITSAPGQIYRDGVLLNQQYGYQEMFGFDLLSGSPFYFYLKDGVIHISYNNQSLPLSYAEVRHYGCCSAAAFNPTFGQNWVGFYGRQGTTWYYVEIGKY